MSNTPGGADDESAFAQLMDRVSGPPLRTAVIHPCDPLSLGAAIEARERGLLDPVLVGPEEKIRRTGEELGASLDGFDISPAPHSHAAAELGVELVRKGAARALMKGKLHTNEVMAAAVDRRKGLRTERRMSHVFVLETPAYPKWLLVSDGAINIQPDLTCKKSIVQNAIDLARAIGTDAPAVAILSATEEVDPNIASTIDAAALCKMADREQITGGRVDGPLAFDLAVSADSVRVKGLKSDVAGHADVLIVPNLEAGNMVAKQLDYLAGASAAGIVLGARAPIILTSRADSVVERLASCALARHLVTWQEREA
ncbi:MAG: bifunctional enoyl-CoA hydratase/phosphate acetyltransferase [Alphaproteobacteria bacterium]|jgi:phosphate acetyltransferase/phosphate butyryltransferase|nr:bifunctional enoyl-CoA hydratase/phosphate acetyltransferase [Alphaproteobacteria bacterium]